MGHQFRVEYFSKDQKCLVSIAGASKIATTTCQFHATPFINSILLKTKSACLETDSRVKKKEDKLF